MVLKTIFFDFRVASRASAENARSIRPANALRALFAALVRMRTRPQVELKNLNSFRAVQESVDFEIVRQAKCVFFFFPDLTVFPPCEKRTAAFRTNVRV